MKYKTEHDIDVKLAEHEGECVHVWDCIKDYEVYEQEWSCDLCGKIQTRHNCDGEPPQYTPRAHSTDELINYAHEKGLHIVRFDIRFKVIISLRPIAIDRMAQMYTEIVEVKDYGSPAHAARIALGNVIIEAREKMK